MNMDLQGFLDYYKRKSAHRILCTNKGHSLSDTEAKTYVRWGIKQGYTELKQMPEFEDVKNRLGLDDSDTKQGKLFKTEMK